MLSFFQLLLVLINIDQETILNWFGIKDNVTDISFIESTNLLPTEITSSSAISMETLRLIVQGLWVQLQAGLTLSDIETILFFILFVRFIILSIRYNLKTSFYITCIGIFAGYLWYRHLIDLIAMYRSILIKLPYLHKLGIDAIQLRSTNRQMVLTDLKLGENVRWYNPGQLIYYSITKGIVKIDPETSLHYYIDPLSMIVSRLNDSGKDTFVPIYYKVYNRIIPQAFEAISKFWAQLSGIAAYALITRIGKRYCPYLVRWHWTFLLIIGFIEQIIIYFCYRVSYFQSNVLIPQIELEGNSLSSNSILQVTLLNGVLTFLICFHFGLIFFGLFHAIWGQYFYFPFLVENTELHIGPRPKNSIYSGGATSWQDEKNQNIQRVFPKLWYGWFGTGTNNHKTVNIFQRLQILLKNIIKRFRANFRR